MPKLGVAKEDSLRVKGRSWRLRRLGGGVAHCAESHPLVMVGAFPPPILGMAAVNAFVRDALRQRGTKLRIINVASSSLDRALVARLNRLPRVLGGLMRFAVMRGLRNGTFYMSVSGGFGQLYEVAFVALARLGGMKLCLHHHSFAYLDTYSRLTQILTKAAGASAIHVAQSPEMSRRLRANYGAKRFAAISNAVFLLNDERCSAESRYQLRTIGFISNIAPDKGVIDFFDLMVAAENAGLPLRAKLAGPFRDAETESQVRSRLAATAVVEYVGPKYGAEKDAFFADLDALIFPTRYINEAEPVTIHEAMRRAIPVIAYGRGCIPEIVGSDCGLVIDPAEHFVPAALKQIKTWQDHPAIFQAASKGAAARFAQAYVESRSRWQILLNELAGGSDVTARAVETENFRSKS